MNRYMIHTNDGAVSPAHSRKESALLRLCESEYCHLGDLGSMSRWGKSELPYVALAEALAAALDAREHETGLHSKRVACHTLVLARRFIKDAAKLRQVYWGALLHDIGKIGIPVRSRSNRGRYLPTSGARCDDTRTSVTGSSLQPPHLTETAQIVLTHEERFDGSGYPCGLAGREIHWPHACLLSSTPWMQ